MYKQLLSELGCHSSPPCSSLLKPVYLKSPDKAVKYWLACGWSLDSMPLQMLFHGYNMELIGVDALLDRLSSSKCIYFIPELINNHNFDNSGLISRYEKIATESFLSAYSIVRAIDETALGTAMGDCRQDELFQISRDVECHAAIVRDDLTSLKVLVAQPNFVFVNSLLTFAARCASIECFRFLSINQCEYTQDTMEEALYGGHEEIIQMCLEHDCTPTTDRALIRAIEGHQNHVVQWLIDVFDAKLAFNDLIVAFDAGNWIAFINLYNECSTLPIDSISSKLTSTMGRSDDMFAFVTMLLADDKVTAISKTAIVRDVKAIMLCNSVNMIDRLERTDFTADNLYFAASNNCAIAVAYAHAHDYLFYGGEAVAISIKNRDMVALMCLIENDANVNCDLNGIVPLIEASEYSRKKMMLYLLSKGADVNETNPVGQTALMHAAESNSRRKMQFLISHGARTNIVDDFGDTAMIFAAKGGNVDNLRLLVESGLGIDDINYKGQSALMMATRHFDAVKYLVEQGADVNRSDYHGNNVIMYALSFQNDEIFDFLLQHGARITTKIFGMWYEFDWYFQPFSDIHFIKHLVDHGVNLNEVDSNGMYPLQHAIVYDDFDLVRNLVELGADVSVITETKHCKLTPEAAQITDYLTSREGSRLPNDSVTLLFEAINRCDTNMMINTIIDGANVNSRNEFNQTPLMVAITNHHWKQVDILIDYGADITLKDNAGMTALDFTLQAGNVDLFAFLNEKGAVLGQIQDDPLVQQIVSGNAEMVQFLITANPDHRSKTMTSLIKLLKVNEPRERGQTLLHIAAKYDDVEIIKTLLESGLDLHSRDNRGNTVLHAAAKGLFTPVFKFLMDLGADPNARNATGKTPLMVAAQHNSHRIVSLLIDSGVDVNATDNVGRSALLLTTKLPRFRQGEFIYHPKTCQLSMPLSFSLLVNNGADVNSLLADPGNALAYLVCQHNKELIAFMIKSGVDIESIDCHGYTPLLNAVRACSMEMVTHLLMLGADIEGRGAIGKTPFTQALLNNDLNIIACLVRHGCNTNVCPGFITETRCPQIQSFLQKNGVNCILRKELSPCNDPWSKRTPDWAA